MKISVIIPLFNKVKTIERSLASVLAQTVSKSEMEVIVVDDGSTDNGADIVRGFSSDYIHLISQENRGPGAARNTGIERANGEFLAFLDADDEWLPTYLEKSIEKLNEYGKDVASISSCWIEYPSGRSAVKDWSKRGLSSGTFRLTSESDGHVSATVLAFMCPPATIIRKDIALSLGGFYDKSRCLYGEDSFLWFKLLLNYKIAINLEPLAIFHREDSELSARKPGPRPIEPLLTDRILIEKTCPQPLAVTMQRIIAIRALKTACMLGYWGHWRQARDLLRIHVTLNDWQAPLFIPALICATRLGPPLGKLLQKAGIFFPKTN